MCDVFFLILPHRFDFFIPVYNLFVEGLDDFILALDLVVGLCGHLPDEELAVTDAADLSPLLHSLVVHWEGPRLQQAQLAHRHPTELTIFDNFVVLEWSIAAGALYLAHILDFRDWLAEFEDGIFFIADEDFESYEELLTVLLMQF
eukprot:CAMPEP_0170550626 /NCGR_PEP_ID=MMETSP0211-20121228/8657_1 /TAXON_ID=311385 /ORGANISM="Pseudokeronopsis sp., Strain OXSARD2" /LENGTH=145 /DNA_ID=CAMNT_0010857263 /DNA_START=793 /DNA_END=1230 /DNA_ORIENTATION=-